jgi:hypothetical protein
MTTATATPTATAITNTHRTSTRWAAAGGALGTLVLASSFVILPQPPPVSAPVAVLDAYARAHHDLLLWAAWLEGTGTLLYVIFLVVLATAAGKLARPSSVLTAIAAAVVLMVSLVYDICLIAIAQSAATGGSQILTGVVAYGLWTAAEHAFLIAPAVFLPLGFAIRGSTVLPGPFAPSAIALGCASEILGVVGLFHAHPNNGGAAGIAINLLIGLEVMWTITAAVYTLRKLATSSSSLVAPPPPMALAPHPDELSDPISRR